MDITRYFIRYAVYPYMELKTGNKIRKYLNQLKATEKFSENQMKSLQEKKLRKLLKHCIHHVPAYKNQLLEAEIEKDPFSALKAFPVLTKETFMNQPSKYLSDTVSKQHLVKNTTGGSTGEPVSFYLDRHTIESFEAARWRGLSWHGIKMHDRSVMIWGSPIELSRLNSKKYYLKERFLRNRLVIPAYQLNPSQLQHYMTIIKRFKPQYIYGYASALYAFAELIHKAQVDIDHTLKGVVSTAETLYPHYRKSIEKAFKTKVINEYGARDGGIIAYEGVDGQMYVTAENLILEIVDPKSHQSLEQNESGSVLVTDLNNLSMPRLRYQVGDIASLSYNNGASHLPLPVLTNIEGRVDEMFVSKDGTLIHGHFFNHLVRNSQGIKQFQLIQHDIDHLTLKIVKNENYSKQEVESIVKSITKRLQIEKVTIEYCSDIPKSKSGKIRYAIREFSI